LEELLQDMLKNIRSTPIREKMREMVEDGRLLAPLTPAAIKKESQYLLELLREEGDQAENKGD